MKPVLSLILAALALAPAATAQEKVEAITRPSQDVIMSFVRPGRIAQVLVKEGDAVKKGDELIRLDDDAELLQIEQLKAQAEDDVRVRAAQAQLEQKRVDLRKTEWARDRGAATDMEVEHAKLDVTIAELSLELSQFEHKQDQFKYREAVVQVARMRLKSPIDGKVERVLVEPGEGADSLEKIIQVVQIDPLWIDVPVPQEQARRLRKGRGSAEVEFQNEQAPPLRVVGDIIHVAAVGDAASATLTVRVEAPNASQRPAGERVYVSFPAARAAQAPPAGGQGRPTQAETR